MKKTTEMTPEEYTAFCEAVYKEATAVRMDTLPAYLEKVQNDYKNNTDYNTAVIYSAAATLATAWAMSEVVGMTGFQAGALFWEFTKSWKSLEGPAALLDYSLMIYPQYEDRFSTVSKETMEWVRERAAKKLEENPLAHPGVIEYWQQIVNGYVPGGLLVKD